MIVRILLLSILCFFSGSIMYSYLIPKYLIKIDPRSQAFDKNPGSSNAMKACGPLIGCICTFLDVAKAAIPVYISIKYFKITDLYITCIAFSPVLGHAFTPLLGFQGGKAVACTFGTFIAIYPLSRIIFIFAIIIIFYKFIITIKPNSSMMIISLLTLTAITLLYNFENYIKLLVVLISILVIYKQKLNPDKGEVTVALFNRYLKKQITKNRNHEDTF